MSKILVSACLVGKMVRYDGKIIKNDKLIDKLNENNYEIIPFCPEVAAGLGVPRKPSEIEGGNGKAVFKGKAKVLDKEGTNVTDHLLKGAEKALEKVIALNIKTVLLKDGCASCGSSYVMDGSFNGIRVEGKGITALLLEKQNIKIFNENEVDKLIASRQIT